MLHGDLPESRQLGVPGIDSLQDICGQDESDCVYIKALCVRFDMDFDGLRSDIVRMLGGEQVKINTRSVQNDMRNFDTKDDVLTLLVHLGYDYEAEEAFIPNKEIIQPGLLQHQETV